MQPEHAAAVLEIYQLGIDEQNATFETAAPTWEAFDAAKLPDHRFVALDDDCQVVGWAAVVPVSDRCAYAGVVEHSVYAHPDARGRGVGLALLTALIASTEAAGSPDGMQVVLGVGGACRFLPGGLAGAAGDVVPVPGREEVGEEAAHLGGRWSAV
ncbi:GNAT family N-acetyltransferase [Streptomyces sp. Li-HN-5-11]|uniref:GNAT family N-acetyltransferase n=1 Tax=Streptomyces sp. Li-HN-5-11 TaxID=3075432 RepID=UPI0028B02487|nr:N-acetyltransferase family protein [Streptomyces sp. Li-HN-5-11]WNM36583.1 GNAT family N-acetyltransferase [Streptomyces sp. Li-HN-5-11]